MVKKRGNIIIIEGPQGVGKSTLANFIRDTLPTTNLYRLSGIADKTDEGKNKTNIMYLGLINYMETLEQTGLNLVFDRTFFSELVYCKLGYKKYSFDLEYVRLVKKLDSLDFNIYLIVLYLKDVNLYEKRLRRVHHGYQEFSLQNSIDQQNQYLDVANRLRAKNIKVLKVSMDDYDKGYNKVIRSISILKENSIVYNDKKK